MQEGESHLAVSMLLAIAIADGDGVVVDGGGSADGDSGRLIIMLSGRPSFNYYTQWSVSPT